jgi:hypothetical protein
MEDLGFGPDSGHVGRDWSLSHGTGMDWAWTWADLILDMSITFGYGGLVYQGLEFAFREYSMYRCEL